MTSVSVENENDSAAAAQMRPDIVMRAEEAQVQASAELVAGLRQMVNNRDFSDVVFLCNNGVEVSASRMLLAGRSDVLRSLLMNGMAESNLAKVSLAEVSSPEMLSVLEFLYTGTMADYHPQNWNMGWGVIFASRFFLLPKLEIIVRKFMHAQIVNVGDDLTRVATLLTEAVRMKALRDQTDESLRELVSILSSYWSDSVFVQNLSEDAFHYLLANSRSQDDHIFSLREYFRFRQVIQWWVYRSNLGSHSQEELMSSLVPGMARVLSICGHPENMETGESPEEDVVRLCSAWNSLQSDEASKTAAISLLSNIEYRLIHPVVLAKVVEPLKISSGEIVNAFRFHALRRTVFSTILEFGWHCGQSYNTFEHGHVIYRTGEIDGLAVSKEAIVLGTGVYEWEIFPEEGCSLFAELGLVAGSGSGRARSTFVSLDKKLSNNDFACVLKSNGNETKASKAFAGRRATWEVLRAQPLYTSSRVSFVFDTDRLTVSLSINGQGFGVVWKMLPNFRYHPAVSFGSSRHGRIRIELVRGFEILQTTRRQ